MNLGAPRIDITAQRGPIETSEMSETKGETEDCFHYALFKKWINYNVETTQSEVSRLSNSSVSQVGKKKNKTSSFYEECNSVRVKGQVRGPLTCRMRHQSDRQLMSSQGWNIPRVTQLIRITSMDMCSNHVQEVKVNTQHCINLHQLLT